MKRQGQKWHVFTPCWQQQLWQSFNSYDHYLHSCVWISDIEYVFTGIASWIVWGIEEEMVVEGRKLRTKSWTGANNPTSTGKGGGGGPFFLFFPSFFFSLFCLTSSREGVHASCLYYLSVVTLWLVGRIHFVCVHVYVYVSLSQTTSISLSVSLSVPSFNLKQQVV